LNIDIERIDMPEPVTGTAAAIVKAISVAGEEGRWVEIEKNVSGLVMRMLGPAADEATVK